MFPGLFQCISCKNAPPDAFPLCQLCAESLVSCPVLCPKCASPLCLQGAKPAKPECLRPWIQNPGISSFTARYLLLRPGYQVLRAWKKHHGLFFDRMILKSGSIFQEQLVSLGVSALIPIPQRLSRSWLLRGSPALRIAQWISQETGIPIVQALRNGENEQDEDSVAQTNRMPHQAELPMRSRFANTLSFHLDPDFISEVSGKKILLVDDFITTGHTVRKAAAVLTLYGVLETHVFSLGIKLLHSEKHSHLIHCMHGTIPISKEMNSS